MNKLVSDLKAEAEVAPDALAILRRPFEPHHISRLPKPTKAQTDAVKADFKKGVRCKECGSWHHPDVVHLDYVGHAALTDRLLDADPMWFWEPVAFNEAGLPAFDGTGGLWIRLTVGGVTRLGYGHAASKPGQDPGAREKEVIGDALRNAAMRFGAALDLWHKGDLHLDETDDKPAPQQSATKTTGAKAPETPTLAQRTDRVEAALRNAKDEDEVRKAYALASKVCAELSTHDPARLEVVEKTYAEALAKFAPPADDFGIGDDSIPF